MSFFFKARWFYVFTLFIFIPFIAPDPIMASGGPPPMIRDYASGLSCEPEFYGFIEPIYPASLCGFYFDWERGTDRHLRGIQAWIHNEGVWNLGYYDSTENDNYHYIIKWQELPPGTTFHELKGCGYASFSRHLGTIEDLPGVPVLVGFYYEFIGKDHHIRHIKAQVIANKPQGTVNALIGFEDKNGDDQYYFEIYYAMIPEDRVQGTYYSNGYGNGLIDIPITGSYPTIQGFDLEFSDKDHHVDRVGVLLYPKRATLVFGDKNEDDRYHYRLWWADVD